MTFFAFAISLNSNLAISCKVVIAEAVVPDKITQVLVVPIHK